MLELEKKKISECDDKLKHALADFQNLEKKTKTDIENGVNQKISKFILDFLEIYDDFVRAKKAFDEERVGTEGLAGILKNMDSLLIKYGVQPLDAIGETL